MLYVTAFLFLFCLLQEFTCKIGCGTVQDSRCGSHSGTKFGGFGDLKDGKAQSETKTKSLWSRMTFRKSTSDLSLESGSDVNAVIGGVPACIFGQFGEVIVFMEPLLDVQVQSLFKLGMMSVFWQFMKVFVDIFLLSLCYYHCMKC